MTEEKGPGARTGAIRSFRGRTEALEIYCAAGAAGAGCSAGAAGAASLAGAGAAGAGVICSAGAAGAGAASIGAGAAAGLSAGAVTAGVLFTSTVVVDGPELAENTRYPIASKASATMIPTNHPVELDSRV